MGSGRGGGGALSIEELVNHFRPGAPVPLIAPGSVVHTDAAKAYRRIGPLYWPERGALQDREQFAAAFQGLGYLHTVVRHKKVVGEPIHYTRNMWIAFPDGSSERRVAGTQKVDGYWASLRREVGRTSLNSGRDPDSETRSSLHQRVRVHQWRHWHVGEDMFALFCQIVRSRRESLAQSAAGAR